MSLRTVAEARAAAQRVCPVKDETHGWSVADFEELRPYLTGLLKRRVLPLLDAQECRRILIRAPVKSGKREMVEYLAVRDYAHNSHRVHAFVSAFHRTADEVQRSELKNHNMEVYSLTNKANAVKLINWIETKLSAGKEVVLHLDECDFGAGDRQVLSNLYKHIKNKEMVSTILYSATPQEVLFSGEVEEDEHQGMIDEIIHTGERIEYEPPATFCGPARFLDAGLVEDAIPFFRKTASGDLCLSSQGLEIMRALRESIASGSKRNILVLRLSYSDLGGKRAQMKANKSIYRFLHGWQTIPELAGCLVYADKAEKDLPRSAGVLAENIKWSNKLFWDAKRADVPVIMVIDQTSSRSTEWACHDRVFAFHDFRNELIFSTISQAQERVNHYEGRYGGFQPIKIYGHKKSFLLSAGRINYKTYMTHEWEDRKVNIQRAQRDGLGENPLFEIKSTSTGALHPSYPTPLSREDADKALQDLGCFAAVKVSPRVKGGVKVVGVFATEFFPCTKDTFPALNVELSRRFPTHHFQNPFPRSEARGLTEDGAYQGYNRGIYKKYKYEDIVKDAGWGAKNSARLTICYRGDTLGVALRYDTGERETVNTLEAFKSMYCQ